MPEADAIDMRAVGLGAVAIVGIVGAAIGSVFAVLAWMGDAPGGAPANAAAVVRPLRDAGAPTLQTAPQDDLAAIRRQRANVSAPAGGADR